MSLKQRIESIRDQCTTGIGQLSIEPNRAERLLKELAECCLDQEERLLAVESLTTQPLPKSVPASIQVEQRPRQTGADVTRFGKKPTPKV